MYSRQTIHEGLINLEHLVIDLVPSPFFWGGGSGLLWEWIKQFYAYSKWTYFFSKCIWYTMVMSFSYM